MGAGRPPKQPEVQQIKPAQPTVTRVEPNLSVQNVQFVQHEAQVFLHDKNTGLKNQFTYESAMRFVRKYPKRYEIL